MDTRKFFDALQSDVKNLELLNERLGIAVKLSPFETVLAKKLAARFYVPTENLIYHLPWERLVKTYGKPDEDITLDYELFRAYANSERWAQKAMDYLPRDFEGTFRKAANLLSDYLYDTFGESVTDAIWGIIRAGWSEEEWNNSLIEEAWNLLVNELWKKVDNR